MLFGFELHQQRLDGLSTSDSIYERVLPRPNFRELLRKARSLLRDILACSELAAAGPPSPLQPPEFVDPARPREQSAPPDREASA
jgi:hypothetical protein